MTSNYYEISKWGDPSYKEPIKEEMVALFEQLLGIKIDLTKRFLENTKELEILSEHKLKKNFVTQLIKIVGEENIGTTSQERLTRAKGKSYFDVVNIRKNTISFYPDLVVYPRNEGDVVEIVKLCDTNSVPIIPIGGRSTVTEGFDYRSGGIALDLTKHMNHVKSIDTINQSVVVEPGIYGPEFENELNERNEDHKWGYTCGHFPQSFEYSTVGGWLATRGAGQESTGYGKIEQMVLGLRLVTPQGIISVKEYPARSTGPDIIQMVIGSEGVFGIITEITMKIHRRYPENTKYFSYLFKDWDSGLNAVREMMQYRFGYPFVFRLSDPEETYISIESISLPSWKEKVLQLLGYNPNKRVLLLGTLEGNDKYTSTMKKQIKKIAKSNGGFSVGSSAVKHWMETRFSSSYLRDAFISAGMVLDTLETSCTWSNIKIIWQKVRDTIKERENTILMTHLSHVYENGANLYFIFIYKAKEGQELEDFTPFHKKILESIIDAGGSLSHHHGIGNLMSPYFENEVGTTTYNLLKAMKQHLDPNNILNPHILFD